MSVASGFLSGRRPAPSERTSPVRPPTGRRDRRMLVLVGSVSLIAACIVSFVALYSTADRKVPAVVMIRSVAQGKQITSADLGEAQVAVSAGVGFIPLAQAQVISGKRAATAIPAGTLVTLADLTGAPAIPVGDAVVGVALKDGAYPSEGLSPGDQVLVVQTDAPGAAVGAPAGTGSAVSGAGALVTGTSGATVTGAGTVSGDPAVLVPRATVFASAAPVTASSGGITLLASIDVPSTVAAQVATAAAAGQVGLVLLPRDAATSPSAVPTGPGA